MRNSKPHTSSYAHSRPAPRTAPGKPANITDDVTWTRILDPHELYRIGYLKDGVSKERTIELTKIGHSGEQVYLAAFHLGVFKTFRADHVTAVEQLSTGHAPSIVAWPQYSTVLPRFPVSPAVYKMPTFAPFCSRYWTVDLSTYSCTCPEKRRRSAAGFQPGQLGYCCGHVARAILEHLPADAPADWTAELKAFLADARKMHIDNLPLT